MEEWRDIKGYEGLYQASSFGRIRSLNRMVAVGGGGKRIARGKIHSLVLSMSGYFVVGISKNGDKLTKPVHRLIASAFISNTGNKPEVNHKDGNKQNNHWKNLEWSTSSENIQHAYDTGLKNGLKGESNGRVVLTEIQANEIKHNNKNLSHQRVAEIFNVKKSTVCNIRKGRTWKHI